MIRGTVGYNSNKNPITKWNNSKKKDLEVMIFKHKIMNTGQLKRVQIARHSRRKMG